MTHFALPDRILRFSKLISDAGGTAYIAGGCVRDHLLGIESKDIDLEIHGLPEELLVDIIKQFPPWKAVGKAFGVWKLLPANEHELEIDVALPQQAGEVTPFIGTKAACIRRDLTINAMLWNIKTQTLEDPFNGKDDLEQRRLKATHPEHFAEDPLRVFRVAQFAGRLQCSVAPDLEALCKRLTQTSLFPTLPKERVITELEKGWFKSIEPHVAIRWMVVLEALQRYLPTFASLSDEAWKRTYHRIEYAAGLRDRLERGHSMGLFWAMLTHELTEAERTVIFNQLTIERFHGFPIRRSFEHLDDYVACLTSESSRVAQNNVGEHIRPGFVYDVAECATLGQAVSVLENRQQSTERGLIDKPLPRLVSGKDLLNIGLQGADVGIWMNKIRNEQIHERLSNKTEALKWVKENI